MTLLTFLGTGNYRPTTYTLAREWLVSLLVVHFNAGLLTTAYKSAREPVEQALSNQAARLRKDTPRYNNRFDDTLQALPEAKELGKLWDEMTNLRNDIAHVGMNTNPNTAAGLRQRAEKIYPRLQSIWTTFGDDPKHQSETPQ